MKRVVAGVLIVAGTSSLSLAQSDAPVAQKTWVDNVAVMGDFRYRYESIQDDSALSANKQTYTRQRDRLRARLGVEAKINDDVKVLTRITSDTAGALGGEPTSGNQTLGDGASKKPVYLDLGYLDWNLLGENPGQVHAFAGKMPIPFITMPSDDLSWKAPDLTPEGLAARGQIGSSTLTFFANGAYLWVQERNSLDAEMCYAGQLAAKYAFIPEVALTVGAAYNDFRNVQGSDVIDWQGKNNSFGNSTVLGTVSSGVTNKAWATGFTPFVAFAQLDLVTMGLPLALYAQTINNGDADTLNRGAMGGLSLGKAKNPKTYEVGYSYAKLEKDATIGMWTDADRWGGGTDGKGSKVYAKYQLMKNLQAAVTYFYDKKTISDASKTTDYDRLQFDLVASF